jgi:hypothetical protein
MHYYAPEVTGLVLDEGAPVAGAHVELSARFTTKKLTATTESNGHFRVGPIRHLELTRALLGDPLFGYSLVISRDGTTFTGADQFGLGFSPSNIDLICDLAGPVRTSPRHTRVYCDGHPTPGAELHSYQAERP